MGLLLGLGAAVISFGASSVDGLLGVSEELYGFGLTGGFGFLAGGGGFLPSLLSGFGFSPNSSFLSCFSFKPSVSSAFFLAGLAGTMTVGLLFFPIAPS